MPGWRKESLGYHTDDGKIYYNDDYSGRETKGLFGNSLNRFKNICHWLLEAVCSAYETNEKWITFEIFWYPPKLFSGFRKFLKLSRRGEFFRATKIANRVYYEKGNNLLHTRYWSGLNCIKGQFLVYRFYCLLLMICQYLCIVYTDYLSIVYTAFLTARSFSFAQISVTSEHDYELDFFELFYTEFRAKETTRRLNAFYPFRSIVLRQISYKRLR